MTWPLYTETEYYVYVFELLWKSPIKRMVLRNITKIPTEGNSQSLYSGEGGGGIFHKYKQKQNGQIKDYINS